MEKINIKSVLNFDIKLGSESYSFQKLNNIFGEEKIQARNLTTSDNLISRLNINFNKDFREENQKTQLDFEKNLMSNDLKTINKNIDDLKNEMNNIKNEIDNLINNNLKSKFKQLYDTVGTLLCNQNVLEYKAFLEKRKKYIEHLKVNNYLNEVRINTIDNKEFEKVLENETYKFTIRLTQNSWSDNPYHIKYCLRFNSNTTFSDKRLKKVKRSYKDYEKAVNYIEGRIKHYKKKYFEEEQPKIKEKFLKEKYFTINNIIQFNDSNLKLEGYN